MYLHVDLCAGIGGWTAPTREAEEWRVVGVDIEPKAGADVVGDVRQLPVTACEPDLLTMSPPCREFSSAWNAVTPPADRDPDRSLWYACREAVTRLEPDWWVLENVAQAQYWMGDSRTHFGPYHLWGYFPPVDTGRVENKGAQDPEWGRTTIKDTGEAARIPYDIADSLRRAVETWSD